MGEVLGWGARLRDPSPPIEGALSSTVRGDFVRLAREALARPDLGWRLSTVFAAREELKDQGLVRALELLWELQRDVLPGLRKDLRVESRVHARWEQAPRRGTPDATATLRRAALRGGELPDSWCTRSCEREVATPVNVYVVSLLRAVERELSGFLAAPRELLAGEHAALAEARRDVVGFVATTPLASLWHETLGARSELRREARRRPAEYRNAEPLERLVERLAEVSLGEVRWREELLSPEFCYEGVVALAFLVSLAEGHALTSAGGETFAFESERRRIDVTLAGDPLRRAPTLTLRLQEDGSTRSLVVEARNFRPSCALEMIDATLYRAQGRPVVLFTPSEAAAVSDFTWVSLLAGDVSSAVSIARDIVARHLVAHPPHAGGHGR